MKINLLNPGSLYNGGAAFHSLHIPKIACFAFHTNWSSSSYYVLKVKPEKDIILLMCHICFTETNACTCVDKVQLLQSIHERVLKFYITWWIFKYSHKAYFIREGGREGGGRERERETHTHTHTHTHAHTLYAHRSNEQKLLKKFQVILCDQGEAKIKDILIQYL